LKIISDFQDYYDNLPQKNKSLVYKRNTTIETDIFDKYHSALLRASIGFGVNAKADIYLTRDVNNISRLTSVIMTPKILGIAGNLYFFVHYKNTLLNMDKNFHDYKSLKTVYSSNLIEGNFKLFESGLFKHYSQCQFKCVNFLMYEADSLIIIREPNLSELGLTTFLSTEECYTNIDLFLKNQVADNKAYASIKATQYERQGFKMY
jgi:hypothetical protein